jgi:hypothetical protein
MISISGISSSSRDIESLSSGPRRAGIDIRDRQYPKTRVPVRGQMGLIHDLAGTYYSNAVVRFERQFRFVVQKKKR